MESMMRNMKSNCVEEIKSQVGMRLHCFLSSCRLTLLGGEL